MKISIKLTVLFFPILVIGCQEEAKQSTDMHIINSQMISTYNDIALESAIISQHTLYPYHFVQDSAQLNELGQHDLNVLRNHFLYNAGHLNIRRGEVSSDLYAKRIESVRKMLQAAGISVDTIDISDEMPGGSGQTSENILVILSQGSDIAASEN